MRSRRFLGTARWGTGGNDDDDEDDDVENDIDVGNRGDAVNNDKFETW